MVIVVVARRRVRDAAGDELRHHHRSAGRCGVRPDVEMLANTTEMPRPEPVLIHEVQIVTEVQDGVSTWSIRQFNRDARASIRVSVLRD